ncbi:23S rRNA (uracil(1939)-C(5))-methyltransferase RlmD [Thermanaeromonas sp.]|uniref:23S rRNA (uracil(1939)-C(5))-methyltransferase RlmD n=1 Tax=Thermanaeromonas sp. TaxID=2003697 RepID=UPI00262FACB9|nr:23S rRNA (uracil(1939)-C(5))-methyltransferase RlmD [Thermanaeromonas sp.]
MSGPKEKVLIFGCSHRGEGLGRLPSGQIIFVPYALPGEEVECRITEAKRDYSRGRLEKILTSSPHRVEPPCPVYYACGGCHLQHADYSFQLEIKKRQVEDALSRIGKLKDFTLKPLVGLNPPWRYRNKIGLHAGEINGVPRLSLYREGSHILVDTRDCLLVPEDMVKVWQAVEGSLPAMQNLPETKNNGLSGAIIRKSFHTGELMSILVGLPDLQGGRTLVQKLCKAGVSSVIALFPGKGVRVLAGPGYLWERIGSFRFRLSPLSFFQVNPRQTDTLYKIVLDYAGLTGKETVLDVYSGTGTIALFLSPRAARVYALEVSKEALQDAYANAKENKIDNVFFIHGYAERTLPRLLNEGLTPEVIVLDPPRQGCHPKVLEAVASIRPRCLIYISCYPPTLARDLLYLCRRGYRVKEIQPVDMFPQTHHVECVALVYPA